jgi:ATP-dependent Lhr-like helicase
VPDFKGIHRAEFDRLIAWMLRDKSLVLLDGRLLIGPKAERASAGATSWSSMRCSRARRATASRRRQGQPLGTLSQGFVDRLVEG